MLKPIRNSIQCKKCGDTIRSFSTHDFQHCSCNTVVINGGLEDVQVIGDPEDYIDFSIFENKGGLIRTIDEDNKFVLLKTIAINKKECEQLFYDFLFNTTRFMILVPR